MGRFQGLSGVKTNQGGLYFLEGDYVVDVDEVKFTENRKKQDCFIISAKVVESTNPKRAPGCKPSQVVVIKPDLLETCMANVKQFAGAIMGIEDPDEYLPEPEGGETQEDATDRFWDESLELLVSEEGPAKGVRIKLNVTTITTKAGGEFSKHVWGPLVEKE